MTFLTSFKEQLQAIESSSYSVLPYAIDIFDALSANGHEFSQDIVTERR